MDVQNGDVCILKDIAGHALGEVSVTSVEADVVRGVLHEGKDFDAFRELFKRHESAVNQQLFVLADEIEDEIAAIHPQVSCGESEPGSSIFDLQIMNAGAVSFRLSPIHDSKDK